MKNWFIRTLALVAALLLVSFAAVAEEETAQPQAGYMPERGISLALTAEDVASGIEMTYYMGGTELVPTLPLFIISYVDVAATEAVYAKYEEADLDDYDVLQALVEELESYSHTLYEILLFKTESFNEAIASGATVESLVGIENPVGSFSKLAENDGYTYMIYPTAINYPHEDPAVQEQILIRFERVKELLDNATYMPVEFSEYEITVAPNTFPAFETVDLNGNTVTNEIFYGKDLTVVNIWGTYCNPCIDEMPDLAEWSAAMPENVQLIGLVCDLHSMDDVETLEFAKEICEATGADVYTSLVANDDFTELLSGIIGVPTTFFVDGTGAIVGDPIIGANVPGCKATVEALLSGM